METLRIIILVLNHLMLTDGRSCPWSRTTAVEVDFCPLSNNDINDRAIMKKCGSVALVQNCSDASKFQYHCLINEAENAFYEVCVPSYIILLGYCAEYNTVGALVQQHRGLKCSEMNPSCPQLYKSTDAYLYQGCYDVVYRKRQRSSTDAHLWNMSITEPSTIHSNVITTKEMNSSYENIGSGSSKNVFLPILVGVLIPLLGVAVTVVSFFFCKWKKWNFSKGCCTRESNETSNEEDEDIEEIPLLIKPSISNKNTGNKRECKKQQYEDEIRKGKALFETMSSEDTKMTAKQEQKKKDTDDFLLAYKDVEECFAKTGLFTKSVKSLKDNGIAILIGPQGSGKTFNAAYIMSKTYESWTKIKFTSWEDLLTTALENKTLVYIDNLLDGYMYQHELRKWWCSLCYFYFERIQPEKNIRLLITAKDNVIKEACDHIGANIFEMPFYLNVESFPLTEDERKDILKLQFQLAEKMGIRTPEINSTYEDIKDKYSLIGFPLCAHLYAFEKDMRTTDVFDDPRTYVIRHILKEIDNDKTHGVKTLFLFLLCYTSPSSFKPNKILDLKYGNDIREYLEDPRVAPKDLVTKMKPLNFENLPNIAESLRYTILIKQSSMYEFKHQIYLDGASDYFFRRHAEVAVHFFPLDILRPYAFPDALPVVWREIIKRFTRELQESIKIEETELNNSTYKNRTPEILSCKIFDKERFEIEFSKELKKGSLFKKLLFHEELRFTFWTSMFGRRELTEIASCLEEEHSGYQFYQSRYGECCEREKKYLDDDTAKIDLESLKKKVWDFRSSDGKSILHLVLCSERSDYEAHCIISRLFNDTDWDNVFQNNDFLNCALEQTRRSRIVCLLEILRKRNETLFRKTKVDISRVIAQIKSCTVYDIHLELEFLVRICIILANTESPTKTANLDFNTIDESFPFVTALLRGNSYSQSTMRKVIKDCIKKCPSLELPAIKPKYIPYTDRIGTELKQAIRDSVQVLSCKDKLSLVSTPV